MTSRDHRRRLVPTAVIGALLAIGLASSLWAATASAGTPRGFWGVSAWANPSATELARIGKGGVRTFRFPFYWGGIETQRGHRDWSLYDQLIGDAARNHVRALPAIWGSPSFVASGPNHPPKSSSARKAFAAFIRAALRRYGSKGSFWAQHRDLPKLPPKGWEVWNEPTIDKFYTPTGDAKGYVRLLKLAAKTIRATDHHTKVVVAGIPNVYGAPAIPFMKKLYKVKGFRGAFDVMNVHPYAANATALLQAMQSFRDVMAQNGDSGKPIWITEVGWASAGPKNQYPLVRSKKGQAKMLSQALSAMVEERGGLKLGLLVWFSWRDRPVEQGEDDWWGPHTGLFQVNGKSKPAWDAFVKVTGGKKGSGRLPAENPTPSPGTGAPSSSSGSGGSGSPLPPIPPLPPPPY